MYHTDDDLDRAILALPLEPLPEGLRASILATVAQRPAPILTGWETIGVGIILALGAWLALLLVGGAEQLHVSSAVAVVARFLTSPATLVWLGAGVGCALCLSLVSIPRRQTARS